MIPDFTKVVSLDAKYPGDLVYLLGETHEELGGSEYCMFNNIPGGDVPQIDAVKNKKLYHNFHRAIQKNLIASSISITRGGLGVALAKKAIGGQLGIVVDLKKIHGNVTRNDFALYSESQGRILVTVSKKNKKDFEKIMKGNTYSQIGKITKEPSIVIQGLHGKEIVNLAIKKATQSYRETFLNY